MIISEKEARTKWCPFVRFQYSDHVACHAVNRNFMTPQPDTKQDQITAAARCIASDCMMWRSMDGTLGFCGLSNSDR
jgi:hypothetical protein